MKKRSQYIEDMLGADNVSFDEETRELYSRDLSSLPGLANQIIDKEFRLVIQPVSVLSLSRFVWFMQKHRIPIVPRGSGTSGWGGALPTKGGACINTRMLKRILYFDEYQLLTTVETGITWRELLMFLESIGLTLPVYPSSAAAATVGGFVASGGIGIGSAKYGDVRNHVVGIEAVLPNGLVVRVGEVIIRGKDTDMALVDEGNTWLETVLEEVPAAAKLDPLELFCGTYGTMGIITKVTMKVIPKLMRRSFACSFDDLDSLVNAIVEIRKKANPYHLRYIMDSYSEKLSILRPYKNEYGKFLLSGALLDTVEQVEEAFKIIVNIVESCGGILLDKTRSEFFWQERFFPLRIKRLGPSLVPSEVLIEIRKIPRLYNEVLHKIPKRHLAVEGTIGQNDQASFLAWILDDERKKLAYTLGWHRSFDIASVAKRLGGKPYAIALWNVPLAESFYGKEKLATLRVVKKKIDPNHIMNPLKIFGGRVSAKKESLIFGFVGGFLSTFLATFFGPLLLNWMWLQHFLWSSEQIFPNGLLLAILVGFFGLGFIYLMPFQFAIRVGVLLLRFGDRLLRRKLWHF